MNQLPTNNVDARISGPSQTEKHEQSHARGVIFKTKQRSIAARLLFWFLAISLIPCAILTTITARIATQSLRDSVRSNLVQIASAKANELEIYAMERVQDGTVLSHAPAVINAVRELTAATLQIVDTKNQQSASADSIRAPFAAEAFLKYVANSFDYSQLLLLDNAGRILFSLDPSFSTTQSILTGNLANTELAVGWDRSRTLLQSELSRFETYGTNAQTLAFVTSPVFDNGRVIGVLSIGFSPERIWQILSDLSGLGDTGEIVAGQRLNGSIVMTVPLRHAPDAAFSLKIPIETGQGSAIQKGVSGERGYGNSTDYRGENVVAAWHYLPSYRWGLTVKQDASEAFVMVDFQRNVIIGIALVIVLGVIVTALIVARSISNPIRTAVRVAKQVAAGDLRADVGATSDDETGALLNSIQIMTYDLRTLIASIQVSSVTLIDIATIMKVNGAEQQKVMAQYGSSTSQTVASVKQISATSQELAHTMKDVNAVAASTGVKAQESRANLINMQATMRLLEKSTASIGEKLATIHERTTKINVVVSTMAKVADQTNLLSINAAIEAEKAGKHGLGFLVVASEISRLADQTGRAALDIERMVGEMQQSVAAGVKEMGNFAGQVRGGVREIGEVSTKLEEINSAVQNISSRFGDITQGMSAQSQGADQIREAMMRLAQGANQTAESLNSFNTATNDLLGAVSNLKVEVSRFTI
ncbi:MAG: methyl-accepting chemotaxis protein [Phycisphaerales bacterium]|nr:methyl-accepting chemotaxis protein [Phycisphaerales bacterium]